MAVENAAPPMETTDTPEVEASEVTTTPAKQAASRSNEVNPAGKPVFKIQILTSDRKLSPKSKQFKGLSPVDSYKEKRYHKIHIRFRYKLQQDTPLEKK